MTTASSTIAAAPAGQPWRLGGIDASRAVESQGFALLSPAIRAGRNCCAGSGCCSAVSRPREASRRSAGSSKRIRSGSMPPTASAGPRPRARIATASTTSP